MRISQVTGFVFSVLILDLFFYALFYDIQKHGLVPVRILSQYQNFMGTFLDLAIILVILFALAMTKDIFLGGGWKR